MLTDLTGTQPEGRTAPEPPAVPTGLFIAGAWREAAGSGTFPVDNPATGGILAEVADGTEQDAVDAMAAAHAAQPSVAALSPRERAGILRRTADALRARTEEFALLITLEMGKPLIEARAEVSYGIDFFEWFAEEAVRVRGDYRTAPDGRTRIVVSHAPVGPCILITPWNFPLAMGARKIAPALAAGCASVLKPAALTPLTSLLLAQVLADAGMPAGGCNVVTTRRAGAAVSAMIGTGLARKLSFTGSTEVGKVLMRSCADQVMRSSMELGGNAPFVVFADADIDAAVDGAMVAKLRNGGEACTAANRFLVEDAVAEEFSRKLTDRMATLRLGPGWEPGTDIGPLIDDATTAKAERLLRDARDRGAVRLLGDDRVNGRFFPVTVLADVPGGSRLLRDEIFAPIAPIVRFRDEDEAVAMANDTEYGLVGYCYTENLARAHRMADRMDVGMVALNRGLVSCVAAPFGGVKQSGQGREGGAQGIHEYLETKYISMVTG